MPWVKANASDEPDIFVPEGGPNIPGYTYNLNKGDENGAPDNPGTWTRDPSFDFSSLTQGNTDRYGRVSELPRDNLTPEEQIAYNANYVGNLDLGDPNFQRKNENAMVDYAGYGNQQFWNMTPEQERQIRDAGRRAAGAGGFTGMSPSDYMKVASIIAAPFAVEYALGDAALGAGGFGLGAADVPSLAGGLELGAAPASTAIGGYGSIAAPSLAGGLALDGGLAGAGSMAGDVGFGLTAADVPSFAGNLGNLAVPDGLTGAEALKYANQARQGVNTASKLAKLLGGTTTKPAASGSGQQLASLLNGGGQSNSFIGQIKGNQNPFIFNTAGQTTATPGTYDVSGMANALRKA